METRSFSSRGVQQEDVWSAADSLIADGLRPTIERVRQKIGRGSPNTVSPMLETWFATLASRLGVSKQDGESEHVPKVLQQAIKAAWEIALEKGREASALEIVRAQDDLAKATLMVQNREVELVQIEQVRAVKQQALEDAVNSAKNITEDAFARLSEAQQLASKRDVEIQNLHARLTVVETARDSEIRQHQEITADYLRERQKIEERAQATQHRLLEEIDRARQKTIKISSDAQIVGRQLAAEKIQLEDKVRTLEKELSIVQAMFSAQTADIHALRETFTASDSRSHEIQILLKAQLDDSKSAVVRLTNVLLNRETAPASGPRFLVQKFKRNSGARKG